MATCLLLHIGIDAHGSWPIADSVRQCMINMKLVVNSNSQHLFKTVKVYPTILFRINRRCRKIVFV